MVRMGKLYPGRPLSIKPRRELLATIKPNQRQFIRTDTGDLPDDWDGRRHMPGAEIRDARAPDSHTPIRLTPI